MKVTFIHHSGFFVEQEHTCFLFDYMKGELPSPMGKPLFIFVSHSHGDHFAPEIFEYGKRWEQVHWILSKDIFQSRVPAELLAKVTFAAPHREYSLTLGDSSVSFSTLKSTDIGNAYLIRSEGQTIYHAGDLHLWRWQENAQDDENMQKAFEREIEALRGLTIDAAFLPLDPRQEMEDRFPGLDYTARLADIRRIYPMHCWEDFSIINDLIASPRSLPYRNRICQIRKDGYIDEI